MATRYVKVDRKTAMLLPPDVDEWVAGDDLARFIVEVMEGVDTGLAQANVRGTGHAQYPPTMMVALLIYSYATGTFSSRAMERQTYDSLATRFICANHHPDHDTIAKFRRENGALLKSCFVEVLQVAKTMGLLRLGMVSVDGTKIASRAGKGGNLTRAQLEEELARLEGEVAHLLARAGEADLLGHDDGTTLPKQLADKTWRLEQLRRARVELDRRRDTRRRQKKREDEVHPVEPESKPMKTAQGPHQQSYNAQAATTSEGVNLIVGGHVVDEDNDRRQLVPTVEKIPEKIGAPVTILADTGYDFQQQIDRLKARGMKVWCPPQNVAAKPPEAARGKERRDVWEKRVARREEFGDPQVKKTYGRRAASSEPCFHVIKRLMGFGRFMLRGLKKVNLEWDLVAIAYNCRKLAPCRA